MTVGDYLDHLLKIGMGWIGWTEEQTLKTSMASIAMAYDGRLDLLQSIFGDGSKNEAAPKPEPEPADPVTIADSLKAGMRGLMSQKNGMGR